MTIRIIGTGKSHFVDRIYLTWDGNKPVRTYQTRDCKTFTEPEVETKFEDQYPTKDETQLIQNERI